MYNIQALCYVHVPDNSIPIYWPCISEIKTETPPPTTTTTTTHNHHHHHPHPDPFENWAFVKKNWILEKYSCIFPSYIKFSDACLFVQFINVKIFVYLNFGIHKQNKITDDFDGEWYQH